MIYIIPVIHEVQARNPDDYPWAKDFLKYLKEQLVSLKVSVVAEEWSIDSLNENLTNISNVKQVVDDLRITYKILEYSIEERQKLGIPLRSELRKKLFPKYDLLIGLTSEQEKSLDKEEAKYFTVREKHWYELIKDCLTEDIILICGANHTNLGDRNLRKDIPFDIFLKNNGNKVKILTEDFFVIHISKS